MGRGASIGLFEYVRSDFECDWIEVRIFLVVFAYKYGLLTHMILLQTDTKTQKNFPSTALAANSIALQLFETLTNYNQMNDYPLSTVSSKKIKKTSKDILEKSACHIDLPSAPEKAAYEHILKGEKLFIEIHYQGKVFETEYNKYVEFMGGTVYKRLNPKVTIVLTNTEQQELENILERVKRICPQCKVVNILWLEMCFQNKCKMPFEDYLQKNTQSKESVLAKKEVKMEEVNLQEYFQNIIEDTQLFYKDYFSRNKKKNFEYANSKKEKLPPHYYIPAQQFELPAVPKKKAIKAESIDKKPKKPPRATVKLPVNKEAQYTKRNKSDREKKEEKLQIKLLDQIKQQKCENSKHVVSKTHPEEKDFVKIGSLNSLMEKYLDNTDSEELNIDERVKDTHQSLKSKEDSVRSVSLSRKSKRTISLIGKESHLSKQQVQSKPKFQRYAITPKYKDVRFQSASQKQAEKMLALQRLKLELSKNLMNRILIVSNSKRLLQKAEQANKQNEGPRCLYFKYLDYETYLQFIQSSPHKHEAYFPINPRRAIDRPLYFALKAASANPPKPVSYNILKEIAAYNKKIRGNQSQETDMTGMRYVVKDKIDFECCSEMIKGKKITFMQSQLKNELLQLVVSSLGGKFVGVNNFMNDKVDVVVTSRNHIKKSDSVYLTQQQLWQKVFPLN